MQVIALSPRFYGGIRRRTGAIFEMDETKFKKKDGKPVLPKDVKAVTDVATAKAEAAAAKKAEADKAKAGAVAASGGAAAKAKADLTAEQLAG